MKTNNAARRPHHPNLESATFWTLAPAAISTALSALESLSRLRLYGADGILQGRSALKPRSLTPLPFRYVLDSLGGATALKGLSIAGATLVLSGMTRRNQQIAGSLLMLVSSKLEEFRNPFGGDGADQMSEVIASYRIATALVPDRERADDLFLRAVNAQVFLAYVASGMAKLISSSWRSGVALEQVLSTQLYGGSQTAAFFRRHPRLSRVVTWGTIAWECAYPLIYLQTPRTARSLLNVIKAFHVGIAMTMGLPRFFWAFASAHSAVDYVIARRSSSKWP